MNLVVGRSLPFRASGAGVQTMVGRSGSSEKALTAQNRFVGGGAQLVILLRSFRIRRAFHNKAVIPWHPWGSYFWPWRALGKGFDVLAFCMPAFAIGFLPLVLVPEEGESFLQALHSSLTDIQDKVSDMERPPTNFNFLKKPEN